MEGEGFKKGLPGKQANGEGLRVGIVHARWNTPIVSSLVAGCKQALLACHVKESDIVVVDVPGSYELPFGASCLIKGEQPVDAVICVGCLIKGETMHFEYICEAVSQGVMKLGLESGVPVIFGVLTCLNEKQALARAGLGEHSHNHGSDWGTTAVEMALLKKNLVRKST